MAGAEERLDALEAQVGEALAAAPEKKGKKNKKNKSGSSRGVETMFRNVYRLHTDLFSLADQNFHFAFDYQKRGIAILTLRNNRLARRKNLNQHRCNPFPFHPLSEQHRSSQRDSPTHRQPTVKV